MLRGMSAFLLTGLSVLSALRVPGPLSPRNASYTLEARLEPSKHLVTGHARITWKNPSQAPAHELVFHLYMNAFRNERSTFMRESRGLHRMAQADKHGWGAITVKKLTIAGRDVTQAVKLDDTLATVPAPAPIAQGAEVVIEADFETLLPKVFARTGFHEEFFAVAQWFPKVGVFDGTWRAHQHHLNSEFFADFGVYDVVFTLPKRFVVAATGVPVGEEIKGEEKTLRFRAEDVHDFALFADPRFHVIEETHKAPWGEVQVALYGQPGRKNNAGRHLAAVHAGLDELARRLGPYPYSRVSVVDPPVGAEGAGGMEYPTLFTTFDAPVPAGAHLPEVVTAHELAHHYFCQMVATDEVEEAWLDEGLTDLMTDFTLSRMFGRAGSASQLGDQHISLVEFARLSYRRVADIDPMETRSFDFLDNRTYGAITYKKTHVVMRTLESHLGEERFGRGLKRYFEAWRFKHPRIEDFTHAFDEGAGEDLSWYWKPLLRGTDVHDYQVLDVRVREDKPPGGLFDSDGGVVERETPRSGTFPFSSEVVVHRRGDFVFPVTLEVVFANGEKKRETWDGKGTRWKRFTYDGPQKVTWATVDPDDVVPLDVRRFNNGMRAEADPAPRARMVSWFSTLVSALVAAVGF
jgi:hypothetical protein